MFSNTEGDTNKVIRMSFAVDNSYQKELLNQGELVNVS